MIALETRSEAASVVGAGVKVDSGRVHTYIVIPARLQPNKR